jgi:hypothetical protein
MLSLHDRRFRAITNADHGEVSHETRFHYRQEGATVWATYAGGEILVGTMVGVARSDGTYDLRYQHVSEDLELRAGRCVSTPEVLADGRLRLHESWEWTEGGRGSGTSMVEEVRR